MGKLGVLLNGVLLSGVLTILLVGSEGTAAPVVEVRSDDLNALEAEVATAPTAANVAELGAWYLDHGQPGLAQSLLDSHETVRAPEVSHLRSRVALAQGQVDEALRHAEVTVLECDDSPCSPALIGRALRQVEFLGAMNAAGIVDPRKDPVQTQVALVRSTREVKLVGAY